MAKYFPSPAGKGTMNNIPVRGADRAERSVVMIQRLCVPSAQSRNGKEESVSRLQDVVVYALRRMAYGVLHRHDQGDATPQANDVSSAALYATRPEASVDAPALERLLRDIVLVQKRVNPNQDCEADSCSQTVAATLALLKQDAPSAAELNADPDIRAAMLALLAVCRETAGARFQAASLGKRDDQVDDFLYSALVAGIPVQYFETQWEGIPDNYDENGTLGRSRSLDEWVDILLQGGGVLLKALGMADAAAADMYGTPQPTPVSLGHRPGRALAVSGGDMRALHEALEHTAGKGIAVYTHGGLLKAHAYPQLRAYSHLAGQIGEAGADALARFPGPVLFTAGASLGQSCGDAFFTSEGYPAGSGQPDDTDAMRTLAQAMPGYTDDVSGGEITTGFGRKTLRAVAPQVADALRGGHLRHIFLLDACAADWSEGGYFPEFLRLTPRDTLILDLTGGACRMADKSLGAAGGLPRLMHTDLFAASGFGPALAEALGSDQVPLTWLLSGGSALSRLFALLNMGVAHIGFGPTLPDFLSPGLWDALNRRHPLVRLVSPADDLKDMLG